MVVGPNNPYVSKKAGRCRKIDLYGPDGEYVCSSRAYDTTKDAIAGARLSGYDVTSANYSTYGER